MTSAWISELLLIGTICFLEHESDFGQQFQVMKNSNPV